VVKVARCAPERDLDMAGGLNPICYFFSSGAFVVGGVVAGAGPGLPVAAAAPVPPAGGGVDSSELQPTKQTRPSTMLDSIAPTLIPNFTDALLRKSPFGASRLKLSNPEDTYFQAVPTKDCAGNGFALMCLRVEL
jgi:hypothetical protein